MENVTTAPRIWPLYAFLTLFMAFLYVRLGEGPMWSHNDLPLRCKSTWLPNILLINNVLGMSQTVSTRRFMVSQCTLYDYPFNRHILVPRWWVFVCSGSTVLYPGPRRSLRRKPRQEDGPLPVILCRIGIRPYDIRRILVLCHSSDSDSNRHTTSGIVSSL